LKKIKLISDFDGIWTNQNIEAEYVWEYILGSLSELTGFDNINTAGSIMAVWQHIIRKILLEIIMQSLIT